MRCGSHDFASGDHGHAQVDLRRRGLKGEHTGASYARDGRRRLHGEIAVHPAQWTFTEPFRIEGLLIRICGRHS
jgi:hypothetical protein